MHHVLWSSSVSKTNSFSKHEVIHKQLHGSIVINTGKWNIHMMIDLSIEMIIVRHADYISRQMKSRCWWANWRKVYICWCESAARNGCIAALPTTCKWMTSSGAIASRHVLISQSNMTIFNSFIFHKNKKKYEFQHNKIPHDSMQCKQKHVSHARSLSPRPAFNNIWISAFVSQKKNVIIKVNTHFYHVRNKFIWSDCATQFPPIHSSSTETNMNDWVKTHT